ncbi:MAG: glutamyl-tRNA reductase [Spirochaetes bacterium]|nr:glutamyl-tRNA reductase [Spirochaetota bacterium]
MKGIIEPIREVVLVGLSHKTAPVEMRERFALEGDARLRFIKQALIAGVEEVVYVATCNRVEAYAASRYPERAVKILLELFEEVSSIPQSDAEKFVFRKYSKEAVSHLFEVASSLDSMVVGENEILGQLKECYSNAVKAKTTGPVLNKLFHHAFRTAKRVRSETAISRNPLSVAFIAVELARKIFEDITKERALIIGAGEMGELILRYLVKAGVHHIVIANRSIANAESLAREVYPDARVVPLVEAAAESAMADILISSVASRDFVLTEKNVREIMKFRKGKPLFIIDIAVPRTIDPNISHIEDVFLYDIDDLKSISEENRKVREREVNIAMEIIEEDVKEFLLWQRGLAVVPAINFIQKKFEEIRKKELARYRRKKLKHLAQKDFKAVEELTLQIMTKTLHNPIAHLKEIAKGMRGHGERTIEEAVHMIMEMFKDEGYEK